MFYDFVRNHALVANNWEALLTGDQISGKLGYVHLIRRDTISNRTLVIRDRIRNVVYNASGDKLMVISGEGTAKARTVTLTSPVSQGQLTLSRFTDPDERRIISDLQTLLEKMYMEYKRKHGMVAQLKKWIKDPTARLFLIAASIYAILSLLVMTK